MEQKIVDALLACGEWAPVPMGPCGVRASVRRRTAEKMARAVMTAFDEPEQEDPKPTDRCVCGHLYMTHSPKSGKCVTKGWGPEGQVCSCPAFQAEPEREGPTECELELEVEGADRGWDGTRETQPVRATDPVRGNLRAALLAIVNTRDGEADNVWQRIARAALAAARASEAVEEQAQQKSAEPEREWMIRVCACGFPLGATLAAIALKKCPDCGRATIPVENQTQRVAVAALPAEPLVKRIAEWLRHSNRLDEIPGARAGLPVHNPLWDASFAIEREFATALPAKEQERLTEGEWWERLGEDVGRQIQEKERQAALAEPEQEGPMRRSKLAAHRWEREQAEPVRATDPVRAAAEEVLAAFDARGWVDGTSPCSSALGALRAALAADREPEPLMVERERATGWKPGDTPSPFFVRHADALYNACEAAIRAGRVDARSALGDAALDYRDERDQMAQRARAALSEGEKP